MFFGQMFPPRSGWAQVFTTRLRGAETAENLEFGEKKNLIPGGTPNRGAHHTFRNGPLKKRWGGGWDFFG